MRGRSLFIFIRDLSYFTVPGYPFASPFERVVYNNTGVPGLLFNLSYCPAENLECNGLQPPHIKKDHYANLGIMIILGALPELGATCLNIQRLESFFQRGL